MEAGEKGSRGKQPEKKRPIIHCNTYDKLSNEIEPSIAGISH